MIVNTFHSDCTSYCDSATPLRYSSKEHELTRVRRRDVLIL